MGRWILAIVLTVALTSVGFGHRVTLSAMTPELAAYVNSGGKLSDICGTADGDGTPVKADCEACRISDNVIHIQSKCALGRQIPEIRVFAFVAKRIAARNDLDPTRLTRAPPQA